METVKKVRRKTKSEDDLIEVIVVRMIAAGKPGEIVSIPRHAARKLQDVGAIKVLL